LNKILFYTASIAQNIVLIVVFIIAGLEAAKDGFSRDRSDYETYELLQSRKVFK